MVNVAEKDEERGVKDGVYILGDWRYCSMSLGLAEAAEVSLRMKAFGECNFESVILLVAIIHPSRSIFGYGFKLNNKFSR